MFHKQTINDYDVAGKIVLLRADYNVPLDSGGNVTSKFRIEQSIPTLRNLIDKGCRIVICSHLGRPKTAQDTEFSLKPVAKELSALLQKDITFVNECVGAKVKQAVSAMNPGDVVLLENLRFHPEEKANDESFADSVIQSVGAEVLVQDGFGVVHRAHASTDAMARKIPAIAGLLLQREYEAITSAIKDPKRPLMSIVGGAKIADKIDIIHRFIDIADVVIIGGAMANTFLKAQGVEVGASLVDDDELDIARNIISKVQEVAKTRDFIFYLPQDGVVATEIDKKASLRIVDWDAHVIANVEAYPKLPKRNTQHVAENEMILDIGPYSGAFISGCMQMCRTVIWNGTMGVSETPAVRGPIGPFAYGTEAVIESLAGKYGNKPFSVLGGGDTTAYVDKRDLNDMFDHVSTGGGASLELMSGRDLPGIAVLWDKKG